LDVVRVYRDVEKYRVGNRFFDPLGSRSDRPDLLAMLRDEDERQEFISRARKKRMPDQEFTSQLSPLYDKEQGCNAGGQPTNGLGMISYSLTSKNR